MPKPELGPIGEQLYANLGWWASEDEANDWALANLIDAFAKIYLEPIYEIVAEGANGEKGWMLALDPENAPPRYLLFQSQFVGAVLTPNMSIEQQRQEIAEPTGWARGRLPSITLIAQRELTGTKWVRIKPRTPGPGKIYIRTLAEETRNPARVEAELLEHGIPAWELLSYAAIEGVTVEDVAAGWKTVEELAGAFATVDEVTHLLPEDLPE
jgi:hypothetical protein